MPGPVCSRQIVLVCLEPLTESGAANSEDNLTACVGTQELALSLTQEGAVAQSPRNRLLDGLFLPRRRYPRRRCWPFRGPIR